jgi:micrococcal nuclease
MYRLSFNIALSIYILINLSCINTLSDENIRTVKKVVDGDTFWVENGSEKGLKIRLIGVDAPESRKTGKKEIGYYGKEAKDFLTKILTGKKVRLEYDVDKLDKYGRTLAYVYLEDGTFVNAELIKQGYAMVMTVPPDVKYTDLFIKLQSEARVNKRGLWQGIE